VFRILSLMAAAWGVCAAAFAAPADEELALYFRAGVERISRAPLRGINSLAAWEDHREGLRQEFLDMLGLWPLPEKTDLRAVTTGVIERDDYVVEKLHFQSLPGLYVTGNLYRPRNAAGRLPAVLYVCGHAQVVTNGVSCGNKAAYQHHGIWFARHGYVCLLIDTLQLGEIMGDHHGTYRLDQWWWNSRGYTPAGVEAWNGVRAIDYLQSRPDVDPDRIGMTGRSGGGSYTWTTAAIDERVRVAAPVAGITDLHNHVVDGVIEGHCDCMFFLNTHGWDFPLNAALIAPRPLLIVNTDTDPIFPLDGVVRLHAAVRPVFQWYQAATNLGLVIGPGGHKDTQDLQVPVFRWFNQHLKGEDPLIARAAVREIDPLELRVFSELPADAWNTRAQREFGAHRDAPARSYDADTILARLRRMVFGGWPPEPGESVRLNLTSPPSWSASRM
jgi:dienelactone hydrolase